MKSFLNFTTVLCLLFSLQSCALFSAVGNNTHGQPVKKVANVLSKSSLNSSAHIDHSLWNQLLKKHVNSNGLVHYRGFIKDEAKLDEYLYMLAKQEPLETWSVQELLAYYINLYNAGTVKLIIENYPIKTIKDINRPWGKDRVSIGDKMISLNEIEHGILRKMNEPRIHFALNCASISCPKLLNEAYTAATINKQLNLVAETFINGPENDISASNPKISSIFKWYSGDFTVNGKKDVIGYINQFSSAKINSNASISYLDYNWNLNETK